MHADEIFLKYKTTFFLLMGVNWDGRIALACVIYEDGAEKATFQHRLRDECFIFQAELLCINFAVKLLREERI